MKEVATEKGRKAWCARWPSRTWRGGRHHAERWRDCSRGTHREAKGRSRGGACSSHGTRSKSITTKADREPRVRQLGYSLAEPPLFFLTKHEIRG